MTIFPAVDNNLFDYPFALILILATIEVNISRLRPSKYLGNPKYIPVPSSIWIWRKSLTQSLGDVGAFCEKVIEDLSALMNVPDPGS